VVTRETGQPAEYLVVEFRPPQGRDLDKAERLFQRATRRADQGDIRGALPELKRLVAQFPEVAKYHQTLGLAHLELENLDAAEDAQIRQHTPRAIFRANVAMNGAFACWFEGRWPRRTNLLGRFQRTQAWPLAERLYAQWQANASQWTPGAEYGWIDRWAEILGLTSWFVWRDDIAGPPSEGPPWRTREPEDRSEVIHEAEQMAYLHYLLGALEWLDREGLARAREVAAEIAALGTGGLDLHGDRQYTLRSLPGKEFSGRHLVSYLYVCLKAIDPTVDPGIDLHDPYLRALELHRRPG
jgi:hypothetical protein